MKSSESSFGGRTTEARKTENLEGGDENKQTIIDVIEHKRGTCFVHFLATNFSLMKSSVLIEGSAEAEE